MYHQWENTRGGSSWSGWGRSRRHSHQHPRPPPSTSRSATLEVFVRGTDNGLYHMWQAAGDWSGWAPLQGGLSSAPVVFPNYDGRLEVFVRGTDQQLYHTWQTTPAGGWSGWAPL